MPKFVGPLVIGVAAGLVLYAVLITVAPGIIKF